MNIFGIYTAAGIEILKTKNYEFIFRCFKENDDDILTCVCRKIDICDNAGYSDIIGIVKLNTASQAIQYASVENKDVIIGTDNDTKRELKHTEYKLECNDNLYLETCQDSYRRYYDNTMELINGENKIILNKREPIISCEQNIETPTVSDIGIGQCLKFWNKGVSDYSSGGGLFLVVQTDNSNYVFQVQDGDVYCGASVYNTCDKGMAGGQQYFRIRYNMDENVLNWRQNLGAEIQIPDIDENSFIPNTCIISKDATYWPVKRFDEDEIVLYGCGGDEYYYFRNHNVIERFK